MAPIEAKNVFLDKSLVDYANEIGTADVDQVRATLEAATTGVTGPVYTISDQTVALSPGSVSLELALGNALNLRLFAKNDGRRINTALRADQRLLWRAEPLQEALQFFDVYQRFLDEAMQGASPRLRTTLARVARTALDTLAQDVVASAQDFEPRLDTDVALADEVNSFRDSSDLLNGIAGKAKILGLSDIQNGIQRIENAETLALLRVIDAKLVADDPYSVRDGNFNWWDGKGQLSLLAFNFGTSAELADHLATQRDYIKTLEQQAEPLIQFQESSDLPRSVQDDRLVAKWAQIIADLRQYDGKKPSASVATLEDFVLNDLDKINPDKSCSANTATGNREQADYFLEIRADLMRKATARCKSLSAAQGYDTYSEIADLFNRTLAGHFPFADMRAGQGPAPRSHPRQPAGLLHSLRQPVQRRRRFAEGERSVWRTCLSGGPVPRHHGQAAAAGDTRARHTGQTSLRWRSNSFRPSASTDSRKWRAIRLSTGAFRWPASSSRSMKTRIPGSGVRATPSGCRCAGLTIRRTSPCPIPRSRTSWFAIAPLRWSSAGTWSLLSFLRAHQAPASDGSSSQDTAPYLLRLRFKTTVDPRWSRQPVAKEVETVVYMQLRIWPGAMSPSRTAPPWIKPQSSFRRSRQGARAPKTCFRSQRKMSSTSVSPTSFKFDIASLLAPVTTEKPCGEYLLYEGTYDRIQEARREDDANLDRGVWKQTMKRADWPAVEAACIQALEEYTKDLQIAAWLLEAWLQMHGFAGLCEGLRLMNGLVREFWDGIYPPMPDGDTEFRVGPFVWINDKIPTEIKLTPITCPDSPDPVSYSWADWEQACRIETTLQRSAANDEQITQARFQQSALLTPGEYLLDEVRKLESAMQACSDLDRELDAKLNAQAPSLQQVTATLEPIHGLLPACSASAGSTP